MDESEYIEDERDCLQFILICDSISFMQLGCKSRLPAFPYLLSFGKTGEVTWLNFTQSKRLYTSMDMTDSALISGSMLMNFGVVVLADRFDISCLS